MTKSSPEIVSQSIQSLLAQRQEHLDALTEIEATLERVQVALRGNGSAAPAGLRTQTGNKRRRRSRHGVSGEDSILAFITQQKNPTSQEIEKHWKSEGRGGAAANMLTKLFKEKTVKREPLKEGRGSRYTLA